MNRIYSETNRIRFTDIPEKYAIPKQFRATQCEVHSSVVSYVFEHYRDTKKYRQSVVDAINCLTYCIMQNDPPPVEWVATDPLDTMPKMDMDLVSESLGPFYLNPEAIEWDVAPSSEVLDILSDPVSVVPVVKTNPEIVKSDKVTEVTNKPLHQFNKQQRVEAASFILPTPKEDLYIQPPRCPRFDVSKVWMSANVGGDNLVIYTTLPEIPTKQNEISVTTNIDMMTDSELMALYPNHVIHTRSQKMYDRYEGIDYDEDLGCIIPIQGFTKEQVIDNIVRYPHLYRLRKLGTDGSLQKFFSTLELSGELVPIEETWDSLPEAKVMPRDPEFVKEYVIRRYLLEEENGIVHKYKMFGSLDPFLTLFMPFTHYIQRGYSDTLSVAKQCVMSRIRYKQTRSPILRRIESSV